MNIHHHHTIHICSECAGCSCSHARREDHEHSEPSRSPVSFLGALGDLARVVATLSLLHVTDEEVDRVAAPESIASPIASEPAITATMTATDAARRETLRALFARAIERKEQTTSASTEGASEDSEVSLSPLAAAFLSVLRGEPTFA